MTQEVSSICALVGVHPGWQRRAKFNAFGLALNAAAALTWILVAGTFVIAPDDPAVHYEPLEPAKFKVLPSVGMEVDNFPLEVPGFWFTAYVSSKEEAAVMSCTDKLGRKKLAVEVTRNDLAGGGGELLVMNDLGQVIANIRRPGDTIPESKEGGWYLGRLFFSYRNADGAGSGKVVVRGRCMYGGGGDVDKAHRRASVGRYMMRPLYGVSLGIFTADNGEDTVDWVGGLLDNVSLPTDPYDAEMKTSELKEPMMVDSMKPRFLAMRIIIYAMLAGHAIYALVVLTAIWVDLEPYTRSIGYLYLAAAICVCWGPIAFFPCSLWSFFDNFGRPGRYTTTLPPLYGFMSRGYAFSPFYYMAVVGWMLGIAAQRRWAKPNREDRSEYYYPVVARQAGQQDVDTELLTLLMLHTMQQQCRLRYNNPQLQTFTPAPVPPPTQYGRTGRKALLVGINYLGSENELRGCINDVKRTAQRLHTNYEVRCLTDDLTDYHSRPTRQNIMTGLQWLLEEMRPHGAQTVFFLFSGHGSQQEDLDGDEADGMDETLVPVDFKRNGMISDDTLQDEFLRRVPEGNRVLAVMDCCHSGTVLDLPYFAVPAKDHRTQGKVEMVGDASSKRNRVDCDALMLSGCEDAQASKDVACVGEAFMKLADKTAGGALTAALLSSVDARPSMTLAELLLEVRRQLSSRGFEQVPQISASKPYDMDKTFFDLFDKQASNYTAPEAASLSVPSFASPTASVGTASPYSTKAPQAAQLTVNNAASYKPPAFAM